MAFLIFLLVLTALATGFGLGFLYGQAHERGRTLADEQEQEYQRRIAELEAQVVKLHDGASWEQRFGQGVLDDVSRRA